jgi:hypothetical protein
VAKKTLKDLGINGSFALSSKNKEKLLQQILKNKLEIQSEWLKDNTVELGVELMEFYLPAEDRQIIIQCFNKFKEKTKQQSMKQLEPIYDAFSSTSNFYIYIDANDNQYVAIGNPCHTGLETTNDVWGRRWDSPYVEFKKEFSRSKNVHNLPEKLKREVLRFYEHEKHFENQLKEITDNFYKATNNVKSVFELCDRIPQMVEIINQVLEKPKYEPKGKAKCSDVLDVDAAKRLSDLL